MPDASHITSNDVINILSRVVRTSLTESWTQYIEEHDPEFITQARAAIDTEQAWKSQQLEPKVIPNYEDQLDPQELDALHAFYEVMDNADEWEEQ